MRLSSSCSPTALPTPSRPRSSCARCATTSSPPRPRDDDRGRGARRRPDRRAHRPHRSDQLTAAALHRLRRAGCVRPVAHRVPVDPRSAQGGCDEPPLDRRGVRRARRGLPVGMGAWPDRARSRRSDRSLRPADHVRDPVRSLDGLRGVPPVEDPGGVPPHRRQPRERRDRCRIDRSGDLLGRARS